MPNDANNKVRFVIDDVKVTQRAFETTTDADVDDAFERHFRGDWGEVTDEQKARNKVELASTYGVLVGRYATKRGAWFYIITNLGRFRSHVCLEDEFDDVYRN